MSQQKNRTGSNAERLLELVERYNLYHVKTLCYSNVAGVLGWLGLKPGDGTYSHNEDSVVVINKIVDQCNLTNVGVVNISDEPQVLGKDRLLVYVKQDYGNTIEASKYNSLVLFLVIQCNPMVPYMRELSKLVKDTQAITKNPHTLIFPTFSKCPPLEIRPLSQQSHPVIDGFLPSNYKTTNPKTLILTTDNFRRTWKPLKSTAKADPWKIYADVGRPHGSQCDFDIEELMTTPDNVLGRGGFGVTVTIDNNLVAKTNLFPEMVNWSVPFIDKEFIRYAHIASQMEEVLIGVSMKHPNILRTFGGFWCEIPGYQLGGRAVLIMERALFSLQEFMWRMNDASVIPAVELDTLRGLAYLRSRTIQHRDLTHRNVLVCHQPGRTPIPFTFKISDFGTACNFSTPDQRRGNSTTMAPEVLWCLNSAIGSDMFSWYCVMWELHSGRPLVEYMGSGESYCKKIYAENLANLVGVYNPENDETLDVNYMKAINARTLHVKHKDNRPTTQMIAEKLYQMGAYVNDKQFVTMGVLCITLFPQERVSPSELLNLTRYQHLHQDVSAAYLPSKRIPLSVRVGEYRSTDIIVADDCVPDGLTKLITERSHAGVPIEVITSDIKAYYGIDFLRLAPDLIQPHRWYSRKAKDLEHVYKSKYNKTADPSICSERSKKVKRLKDFDKSKYNKRKAVVKTDDAVEVRRLKMTLDNCVEYPEEGSSGVSSEHHQADQQRLLRCVTPTPARHMSTNPPVILSNAIDRICTPLKMLTSIDSGELGNSESSALYKVTSLTTAINLGSVVNTPKVGEVQGVAKTDIDVPDPPGISIVNSNPKVDETGIDIPDTPDDSTAKPNPDSMYNPQGDVILRSKRIEGEIDTTMVILKSQDEKEIQRFKDNVIVYSQAMTRIYPLIFAGPRDGLCKCSGRNGIFIFQYAQLFEGCKSVRDWTKVDSPNSVYPFILQVLLTLKVALDMQLLPTHMTEWKDVIISKGAVMIDIVPYLSRNFNKSKPSLFGKDCRSLVRLCTSMVTKHLPSSNLCKWLCGLNDSESALHVLTKSIEWLSNIAFGERVMPCISTLDGNVFTLRDYSSDVSNWLTCTGEEESPHGRSVAKVLVYGVPKTVRCDQTTKCVGDIKLCKMVRNIVLRMRVKVFGSSRLEVATLDCTQGFTKVTLNNLALTGVVDVDRLPQSRLTDDNVSYFTHDAVSQTMSKWAPVIMFAKLKRHGPVDELTVEYYTMKILMVLLNTQGGVPSLRALFQSVATFSVTDY